MKKTVLAITVALGTVLAGGPAGAEEKRVTAKDFTFLNPVNKKIEPKQMYCEKTTDGELVVCGGIYKPT